MKGGRLAIYFAPLYNGGGKKVAEITFNNATNYNPVTVVVAKSKGVSCWQDKEDVYFLNLNFY